MAIQLDCLPDVVLLEFHQPDPPQANAIQHALEIVEDGFRRHRLAIKCLQDGVNGIVVGTNTPGVQVRRNSGTFGGFRPKLNFIAGTNISIGLTEDAGDNEYEITIGALTVGESNTASNLGAGQGWFASKVGVDLQFKSFTATSASLSLSSTATEVDIQISTSPAGAATVVGTGRTLSGTAPVRVDGGASGDLSANRTLSVNISPGAATTCVGTTRTITCTIPIRIDAGASADLSADRTLSFDGRIIDSFDPSRDTFLFDDFIEGVGNRGNMSWDELANDPSASGITITSGYYVGENHHPGILQLAIGAGGETPFGAESMCVYLGTYAMIWQSLSATSRNQNWVFEASVRIPDIGNIFTNYPIFRIGFGDATASADHTDGIYFEFDPGFSANWRLCTANGATRTKNASTVAVAAGTWYNLRFVCNLAATSVEFFINKSSEGSITTNLPNASNTYFSPNIYLELIGFDEMADAMKADVDFYWQYRSGMSR